MPHPRSHQGLALLSLIRWLAIGLGCLVVLAVAGVWGVGRAIPGMIDSTLASQGHSGLTCERNDTNLFVGRVDLAGLSILNPPEYAEREFLRVRRIVVDVQPLTFLGSGQRVIDELTLDIDRVTLVGKGSLFGDNNATAIAKAFRRSAKAEAKAASGGAPKPAADFVIRHLRIRVGGVTLLQDVGGERPQVLAKDSRELTFEASDVTSGNLGDTVVAPLAGLAIARAAASEPESLLDAAARKLESIQK